MKHVKLFEAWKGEPRYGEFLTLKEVVSSSLENYLKQFDNTESAKAARYRKETEEGAKMISKALNLDPEEITCMIPEANDFFLLFLPEVMSLKDGVKRPLLLKHWSAGMWYWKSLYTGTAEGLKYCLWNGGTERGNEWESFFVGTAQLATWLAKKQRLKEAMGIEKFFNFISRSKLFQRELQDELKQYRGHFSGKKFGL
jgi:hypothetical protein